MTKSLMETGKRGKRRLSWEFDALGSESTACLNGAFHGRSLAKSSDSRIPVTEPNLGRTAFTGFDGRVAAMTFADATISSSIRSFSPTGSAAS